MKTYKDTTLRRGRRIAARPPYPTDDLRARSVRALRARARSESGLVTQQSEPSGQKRTEREAATRTADTGGGVLSWPSSFAAFSTSSRNSAVSAESHGYQSKNTPSNGIALES